MATIQVRDVPEEVHQTYRRRAAAAGMSLQEYLLGELTAGARTRTPAEVVAEIERSLGGGAVLSDRPSAELIRDDRDAR